MLPDDVLARARARLDQPGFAAAARRLRAALRDDLARPVLVPAPDRPAGYYHDYFCPQHGVQLVFDWDLPRAHRCPVDGAAHRGEAHDRAWWWFVNHEHAEASFRLALGWRLMGEHACLDRLAAILAAYAAHYPEAGWPASDPRPRQGKVAYTALDEAVWLVPLAWAYSLARAALSPGAQRDVEARLLWPAAEHLAAQRWPQVHNYMCWLNAAVAGAAALLDRADLLSAAIDGPYGFRQQVEEGVLADGTWWEASASYHFYTLAALLALIRSLPEAPRRAGGDGAAGAATLRRHPKVRRMFLAPLRWAYPDLSLPALNDCWYHSTLVGECGHGIPPAAAFYEIAAGWYGDPAFGHVLAANYRAAAARPASGGSAREPARGRTTGRLSGSTSRPASGGSAREPASRPRDSLEALLYGPDEVPAAAGRERRGDGGARHEPGDLDGMAAARFASRRPPRLLATSADLAELGVAVLRGPGERRLAALGGRDVDRRTCLLLKYGPHGGGHGHPDKLGIVLFAAGERLSPDLGTPGYGIPLNDTWYRQTLSHNTVLIDGQSQPPATGRLRSFIPLRPSGHGRPAGPASAATAAGGAAGRDRVPSLAVPATRATTTAGASSGAGATPEPAAPAFGVIDAEVEWAAGAGPYAGVRFRRVVLVRPGYFLDLFAVACPDERQIDWTYHNLGRLERLGPPAALLAGSAAARTGAAPRRSPAPPGGAAAPAAPAAPVEPDEPDEPDDPAALVLPEPIRPRMALPADQDLAAAFVTGAGGLRLWLAGAGAAGGPPPQAHRPWVIAAEAPANPAAEAMALVVRRCRARRALFAAVFHPYAGQPRVREVSWRRAGGALACRVVTRGGPERWHVTLPEDVAAGDGGRTATAPAARTTQPPDWPAGGRFFQYAL